MDEHQIPSLYNPRQPCPDVSEDEMAAAREVEIGPMCKPCPNHGNYPARFYGATFTQSSTTGRVSVTQRHPAVMMLNVN